MALAVHKPGRGSSGDDWPIVAAITRFYKDGEPILKICWRSQHGTKKAISLPAAVLDFAEAAGVRDFYLRADRPGRRRMWTCPVSLFRRGRLQADGERYVPLDWLQEVPWRDWFFATEVKRLGEPEGAPSEQLNLFAEVAS